MRENNNDSEEKENEEEDRRNKTEAGMARGAVRSLGRTAAQLPAVGRLPAAAKPLQLPRPAAVMPRRLPVKQVAKISDRVSQTLDLYDLAAAESAKESHLAKLLGFTLSKCELCVLWEVWMRSGLKTEPC